MGRTYSWLADALAAAAEGLPVAPYHSIRDDGACTCHKGAACTSPGKHPRTLHGIHEATVRPKTIIRWATQWPESNLAIATGHPLPDRRDVLLVLDMDWRHDGDRSLVRLVQNHGELPITRKVQTGGLGLHYYFRCRRQYSCSTNLPGYPGLDIKCRGGSVNAPPSRHTSGQRYAWVDQELPIAPLPDWLETLLDAHTACARVPRESPGGDRAAGVLRGRVYQGADPGHFWLDRIVQEARIGSRNLSGYKLACRLREQGLTYLEARAIMEEYVARVPQGEEPYALSEALTTLRGVYRPRRY